MLATRTADRDTIVAVASPPGRGLRALVRVSGAGSRVAASVVLGIDEPRRGVVRARVRTELGACPVLAMWMDAGASFTGEDSLELSCVGEPRFVEALVAALIEGAQSRGSAARLARAGEFAFRAHLGGRLSVDEAEAIAARIAATSDAELVAADELASGATGARAAAELARVAELLALVEAGIDFTDQEDVVSIAPDALARRAGELADACAALRGAQVSAHALATPLVVLAGPPNAGKSTLFNALLGRPRSIASALAGTTRDAIVERIALGRGIEADLADLAGIDREARGASASIHRDMQRGAAEMLARADVIVRCTAPGTTPITLASGDEIFGDVIDVSTMSDLGAASGGLPVSARTGKGVDELREEIAARIRSDRALRRAQLATVLPRHDRAFAEAERALREVAAMSAAGAADCTARRRLTDVELMASLLRAALDALGEVAGPVHPDDVLGLVFSRFCIGK